MPFESRAQRSFMFAKHPEIAQRWAAEYPNQQNLPAHVASGRNQVANALVKRPTLASRASKPKGMV